MHIISFAILICFIILTEQSKPSKYSYFNSTTHNKIHTRFRRRELVQEEVRKTMINYMTSIKGEITDIVIEEMIDYYNNQRTKIYYLEKELNNIKNSSLPNQNTSTIINGLIARISNEQNLFASNISLMEYKINNLTTILSNVLHELHQQQKPIQHVRRLVAQKKDTQQNQLPIGKILLCKTMLYK